MPLAGGGVPVDGSRARPPRRRASTPSGRCPSRTTYGASVSGPQLAVPTPAVGGVEVDDGLGARAQLVVVGGRVEVGGAVTWQRGHLARRVELDHGRRRRAIRRGASGRRRGRRSPAAGRTARAARSPSTPQRRPARRAAGRGTSRAGPRPNQATASWPGRELEHRADARQVVEVGRDRRPSPRPGPGRAHRAESRCGVGDLDARRRSSRWPGRSPRRPAALDASSAAGRATRRPHAVPAVGHAADPVVVGGGAPQGRAPAAPRTRGGRGRPRHRARRRRSSPMSCGGRGARLDRAGERDLRPADLEARRAPRRVASAVRKRSVSQRSPAPASGSAKPGIVDLGRGAGRDRRQRQLAARRPARRRPSPPRSRAASRVSRNSPRFSSVTRPSRAPRRRRIGPRAPATRAAVCSHSAGLGERSGNVMPSMQNVAVVGLVAEVAAVGVADRAVGEPLVEAVVAPLPDEAALEPGRRLDRVPVLGERAVAVAHRVRVLAHDQRVAQLAASGRAPRCAAIGGYIGQTRSLAVWSLAQSNRIAPS